MIVEETMYGVKCDGCGEGCGSFDHDYAVYQEKDDADACCQDEGWVSVYGKHFCLKCQPKFCFADEDGEWHLKDTPDIDAFKAEMKAKNNKVRTSELERHCKMCQTEKTGEGYGDVPPKIGYDDTCDQCEVAKELRFRMGITQGESEVAK